MIGGSKLGAIFLLLGFAAFTYPGKAAQEQTDKPIYLIARRELVDPFFKQSVVLMLPSADQDVVIGLIVNRPTHIKLSEVFPKDSTLKARSDVAYFGGPVDEETPCAMFSSPKAWKQAVHVVADLYISFDAEFIEGILKNPQTATDVRLFLGRAQWAPEQLHDEMLEGSWYTDRAEASFIFSHEPENVWRTLIGRVDPGTVASLNPPLLLTRIVE